MKGLEVHELNFSYGVKNVLRDVSISKLERGTLTALIGPNASGKSTLFRCISGLLSTQTGGVYLGGADLSAINSKDRLQRICFMPQHFSANAALTVFDVVMMALKNLTGWRVSDTDIRLVSQALEDGGLSHLADAYVGELSGGQAQMTSVAQSLVRQAEVYLFDEPTSALNLRHQLDVLSQIQAEMISRNAIGIVALHDLNLAARFADHLILLGQGRIQAEGPPKDVLSTSQLADVYGVEIAVTSGPEQELFVHAY